MIHKQSVIKLDVRINLSHHHHHQSNDHRQPDRTPTQCHTSFPVLSTSRARTSQVVRPSTMSVRRLEHFWIDGGRVSEPGSSRGGERLRRISSRGRSSVCQKDEGKCRGRNTNRAFAL